MAYRTSVHQTTGQTPARLMLGRDLRLPVDLLIGRPEMEHTKSDFATELQEWMEAIHRFTRNSLQVQSDRMKEYYDQNLVGRDIQVGDAVWMHDTQRKKGLTPKLNRLWKGPFVIIKKTNDLVFHIQQSPRSKPKVLHRNRLWKYTGSNPPNWSTTQNGSNVSECPHNSIDCEPIVIGPEDVALTSTTGSPNISECPRNSTDREPIAIGPEDLALTSTTGSLSQENNCSTLPGRSTRTRQSPDRFRNTQ